MAEVWRARHVGQNVAVAIKFARKLAGASSDSRRRFREEVRAQAGLIHPGIAQVYDYGRTASRSFDDGEEQIPAGTPYLVMEYAPDGTLHERPPLRNWPSLQSTLIMILDALAHGHARGVVHRDLKPSNILRFSADGAVQPKLADFGLAHLSDRRVAEEGEEFVHPTAGTPDYMSPEQFHGKWRRFGPWTDLYQLGAIAWEWATRTNIFSAENWLQTAIKHTKKPLPDFEPDFPLPRSFEPWLRKLLEKNPAERFQRAADAAWHLAQISFTDNAPEDGSASKTASGSAATRRSDVDATAPTLVDTPPPTMTLRTTIQIWSESLHDRGPETEKNDFTRRPPVPSHWETTESSIDPHPMLGTGTGLIGIRPVPFVDRTSERNRLWNGLRSVSTGPASHVALVEGPSGAGKSRLVEWLARRAHEVGAATVLRAFHSRAGSPRDGVGDMIEGFFATWNLPKDDAVDLVCTKLKSWFTSADSDTNFRDDAIDLVNLARAELEKDETGTTTTNGQYDVLDRLVSRLCDERPVLIWIDDAQWGSMALDCMRYILRRNSKRPIYLVLTARIEERGHRFEERISDLESDTGTASFDRLRIDPLGFDDHAELVQRMLPLDEETVERVCERTEGNPLFAVQIVQDWVARDRLRNTDSGFQLAKGAVDRLPDAVHDIWMRRIEDVIASLDPVEHDAARRALQLAAALGRRVERDEWREVCSARDVAPPELLIERLVEAGLAQARPDGMSFIHGMLVESIERWALSEGHWRDDKRLCASTIEKMYPDRPDRTALRRVDYLMAAGDTEAALEPLNQAMEMEAGGDGNLAIERHLERRAEMMDRLGIPNEDRRRVQNWLNRVGFERRSNQWARATRTVERAEDVARRNGWRRELGEALMEKAHLYTSQGEIERAIADGEEAEELFRDAGEHRRLAELLARQAWPLRLSSQFELAMEKLEEARSILEGRGPETFQKFIGIERAMLSMEMQKELRTEARERLESICEWADSEGQQKMKATTLLGLGHIALQEFDSGRALDLYRRAHALFREIRSRTNCIICRLMETATRLSMGELTGPARQIDELERTLQESVYPFALIDLLLVRLAVEARRGDWDAWDAGYREFIDDSWETRNRDSESVWIAELTGTITKKAGAEERGNDILERALEGWKRLDRSEEIERVEAKLHTSSDEIGDLT